MLLRSEHHFKASSTRSASPSSSPVMEQHMLRYIPQIRMLSMSRACSVGSAGGHLLGKLSFLELSWSRDLLYFLAAYKAE